MTVPDQTRWTAGVHQRTCETRNDSPIQKPLHSRLLLHQKEKWETMPSARLLTSKWMDNQELISTPPNSPTNWQVMRMHLVHEIWYQMGVQQCLDQRWWPMESGIHDKQRTVQTHSHVLWTNKLTSHIPDDDEHDLSGSHCRWEHDSIYGWHGHPHSSMPRWDRTGPCDLTQKNHESSTHETGRTWPIPKPRKMRFQTTSYRLSRCLDCIWNSANGTREGGQGERLETPMQCNRSPPIPSIYRILQILYPRILTNCPTTLRSHEESDTVALDDGPTKGIWRTTRQNVHETSPIATKFWEDFLPTNWCVSVWRGSHTLTGGRNYYHHLKTQITPSCLLLCHLHPNRTMARYLWMQIFSSH